MTHNERMQRARISGEHVRCSGRWRVTSLSLLLPWCMAACNPMPSGSGPTPRAVLVVSSTEYSVARVVDPLDSIHGVLGARIDKSKETIDTSQGKIPRFPMFDVAYWYPDRGSDYYGVALVKWVGSGGDTGDRYFIEVYATDEHCQLCGAVKGALDEYHVSYFSACDNPDKSSPLEKARCGP